MKPSKTTKAAKPAKTGAQPSASKPKAATQQAATGKAAWGSKPSAPHK